MESKNKEILNDISNKRDVLQKQTQKDVLN